MEKNNTPPSRKEELDAKYKDGTLTPQETKELPDFYVDGSKKNIDGWTERDDAQLLEQIEDAQRISAAENTIKAEALEEQLKESPRAAYRNSMVDYAKKNESKETAERVEKLSVKVEELRIKWLIKEDADGVSFGGLKTASKVVQDKALQHAFGDKLQSNYWRDDHQGKKSWTKKVLKKDLDAHGDQFGTFALWSMEQLNTMRAWIRENFKELDVKTREDEGYILQMINPDLFEWMWMKDVDWNDRSYLLLWRNVSDRLIYEIINPNGKAGLFLVQNV